MVSSLVDPQVRGAPAATCPKEAGSPLLTVRSSLLTAESIETRFRRSKREKNRIPLENMTENRSTKKGPIKIKIANDLSGLTGFCHQKWIRGGGISQSDMGHAKNIREIALTSCFRGLRQIIKLARKRRTAVNTRPNQHSTCPNEPHQRDGYAPPDPQTQVLTDP